MMTTFDNDDNDDNNDKYDIASWRYWPSLGGSQRKLDGDLSKTHFYWTICDDDDDECNDQD